MILTLAALGLAFVVLPEVVVPPRPMFHNDLTAERWWWRRWLARDPLSFDDHRIEVHVDVELNLLVMVIDRTPARQLNANSVYRRDGLAYRYGMDESAFGLAPNDVQLSRAATNLLVVVDREREPVRIELQDGDALAIYDGLHSACQAARFSDGAYVLDELPPEIPHRGVLENILIPATE